MTKTKKTNINNQSKIILQDQVASIFNGTSLNWLLISSDSEAIKTLKDFEQIQIPQSTDIVILNLINNLSKVVIKQLTDKCIDLNIETLGIIDEDFLRSYEIDSNIF